MMWEIGDQAHSFGMDPCLILGINPLSWAGFMWRRAVWRQWRWATQRIEMTYQKPVPKPPKADVHYRTERLYTFQEAIGLKRTKKDSDLRDVRTEIPDLEDDPIDMLDDDFDPLAGYIDLEEDQGTPDVDGESDS